MALSNSSVVTEKGQVVVPASIRKKFKIQKGTRVRFIVHDNDVLFVPVTEEYIDGLMGLLPTKGKTLKLLLEEKKRERER